MVKVGPSATRCFITIEIHKTEGSNDFVLVMIRPGNEVFVHRMPVEIDATRAAGSSCISLPPASLW